MRSNPYITTSVLDPTVELWVSGEFEVKDKGRHSMLVNYWFTATSEEIKHMNKDARSSMKGARNPLILKQVNSVGADVLSKGICEANLTAAAEFWKTQETLAHTGLSDFALAAAADFWKSEQSEDADFGIDDSGLFAAREFWRWQENSLCNDLSDRVLLAHKDFWRAEKILESKGLENQALLEFKVFWKNQTLLASKLRDDYVSATKEFWNAQESIFRGGIDDFTLTVSLEFWEGLEAANGSRIRLPGLAKNSSSCSASAPEITEENTIVSLHSPPPVMAAAPAKMEPKFEISFKVKEPHVITETEALKKALERAVREKEELTSAYSELMLDHRELRRKLAAVSVKLDVVDEVVGHNVELEWTNDALRQDLAKASKTVEKFSSMEAANLELTVTNSSLVCENKQLAEKLDDMATAVAENIELASRNAELTNAVLTMEKAAKERADEATHLRSIIDLLQREQSTIGSQAYSISDFQCLRRRKSFSRRSGHVIAETSLIPPSSAGIVCAHS